VLKQLSWVREALCLRDPFRTSVHGYVTISCCLFSEASFTFRGKAVSRLSSHVDVCLYCISHAKKLKGTVHAIEHVRPDSPRADAIESVSEGSIY
jgi:hypothetical protein